MQLQHASESRNAIAWDEARKANTAAAYESFWTRYNESCQRYSPVIYAQAERELFESAMRQSEWADYAIFANKFPNNIYVQDSAAAIKMQIAIFKNSLEGYKKYLQAYPQSPFAKIALDSVFAHIERERPLEELDFFVRNYPQSIHIQAVWKILYQEFCKTESCPNAFYSAYPTAPKPLN
jgi:predicted Zn-dependent protease